MAVLGGVFLLAACVQLPQARPLAIEAARTQFTQILDYIEADAKEAPRGGFVDFVDAGGFHIPWSFINMSEEELQSVRWNGDPAVVDADVESTEGVVIVMQSASAYTGGGWMGNSYKVAACWSFTVDLEMHSIEDMSDIECPTKIERMLAGVDEMVSIGDLQEQD